MAADEPFCAFVPCTKLNLLMLPHPDFDGTTVNGRYADVLVEIDFSFRHSVAASPNTGKKTRRL
ncbi:hypothetical protein NBRC116594_11880 [Shimia sp. NS0008-38b]